MARVMIESPYRNGDRAENLRYLAWCHYHSAHLGESPLASHGNCTEYWPEDDAHRELGFAWRREWAEVCDLVCYYADLGISPGAKLAKEEDDASGRATETRFLPPDLIRRFEAGEYPPGTMRKVAV
jgi:hypothetical protein